MLGLEGVGEELFFEFCFVLVFCGSWILVWGLESYLEIFWGFNMKVRE